MGISIADETYKPDREKPGDTLDKIDDADANGSPARASTAFVFLSSTGDLETNRLRNCRETSPTCIYPNWMATSMAMSRRSPSESSRTKMRASILIPPMVSAQSARPTGASMVLLPAAFTMRFTEENNANPIDPTLHRRTCTEVIDLTRQLSGRRSFSSECPFASDVTSSPPPPTRPAISRWIR